MTLNALDMPDEPRALAVWLEKGLVGPDLADLAAELAAWRPERIGPAPTVEELLGDWREPVLAGGFKLAAPELLRLLLAWPERLLDLQELVLQHGGRYWDRLLEATPDVPEIVKRSRQRLSDALPALGSAVPTAPAVAVLPMPMPASRRRLGWAVVAAAVAAAVVLGVFLSRWFPPTPTGPAEVAWGWTRPGVLASDGSSAVYLNRLADAAGEWFAERPEDAAAVAKRLNEFRQGCTAVQLAEHRPLTKEDREWLSERCREWAGKLDGELAEVEAGKVQKGRDDADETVKQLIAALRDRARERTPA